VSKGNINKFVRTQKEAGMGKLKAVFLYLEGIIKTRTAILESQI